MCLLGVKITTIQILGVYGSQTPKISPCIGKYHQIEKLNNFLTVRDRQKVVMEHKYEIGYWFSESVIIFDI